MTCTLAGPATKFTHYLLLTGVNLMLAKRWKGWAIAYPTSLLIASVLSLSATRVAAQAMEDDATTQVEITAATQTRTALKYTY